MSKNLLERLIKEGLDVAQRIASEELNNTPFSKADGPYSMMNFSTTKTTVKLRYSNKYNGMELDVIFPVEQVYPIVMMEWTYEEILDATAQLYLTNGHTIPKFISYVIANIGADPETFSYDVQRIVNQMSNQRNGGETVVVNEDSEDDLEDNPVEETPKKKKKLKPKK